MIRALLKVVMTVSLLIWGCGDGGINLKIRYDDVRGLSEKDRVICADIPIGEVTGIARNGENDYTVDVKIRKDFRHLLTENAIFYLVRDPVEKGKRVLTMERHGKQGPLLQEGASVEGSTAVAEGYARAWEEFQRGMNEFKKELDEFSEEMGKIPESEEFQRLKKEMERIGKEMKRSGKEAKEKIEREILPELERRFEALKEKILKRKKQRAPEPVQVRA